MRGLTKFSASLQTKCKTYCLATRKSVVAVYLWVLTIFFYPIVAKLGDTFVLDVKLVFVQGSNVIFNLIR